MDWRVLGNFVGLAMCCRALAIWTSLRTDEVSRETFRLQMGLLCRIDMASRKACFLLKGQSLRIQRPLSQGA